MQRGKHRASQQLNVTKEMNLQQKSKIKKLTLAMGLDSSTLSSHIQVGFLQSLDQQVVGYGTPFEN